MDKKRQVGKIAQGMLDGTINYLLGAEQLLALRDDLGIYANDPDFVAFVAVRMELDKLRGSKVKFNLAIEETGKESLEIEESILWAKQISQSHCQSLVKRYGE